MFKEQIQKITDMVKIRDGDNNKRKIENLVVFIIVLIITIIMINSIWSTDKKQDDNPKLDESKILASKEVDDNLSYQINANLEEKLKNILSKIDGVGKVEVLITYSESSKVLAMYNEDSTSNDTEEKDVQGRK